MDRGQDCASPVPCTTSGPYDYHVLPPANEVWGKVIFLHLSVILFTGGVPGPGRGVWSGGAWSRGWLVGGLVETPSPRTAAAAGGTHPIGMHSW